MDLELSKEWIWGGFICKCVWDRVIFLINPRDGRTRRASRHLRLSQPVQKGGHVPQEPGLPQPPQARAEPFGIPTLLLGGI